MSRGRTRTAPTLLASMLCVGILLGSTPAGATTPAMPVDPSKPGKHDPARSPSDIALAAATSAIGTPYRFGGASRAGFDCSGLTMWAYGRAGVTLPHSALQQYRAVRHVSRHDLQPGDLVFFYSPIHHVGIYIGRGRMIDANHSGGSVKKRPIYWGSFTGGGRPSSK